jgi:hypothetical protein
VGSTATVATLAPAQLTPTEDQTRAQRFVNAVPRLLEPLRLETDTITTDAFGAHLFYVTNEGVRYQVVLFITKDSAEAMDTYNLHKSLASGWQDLRGLGDEGVIYAPGYLYLAELVYLDMLLVVYNPAYTNTVPPTGLTQNDLLRLMQRLYIALPAP